MQDRKLLFLSPVARLSRTAVAKLGVFADAHLIPDRLRSNGAPRAQTPSTLTGPEKAIVLSVLRESGSWKDGFEAEFRSMHAGVRELRMRNHICSIWTDGRWRDALAAKLAAGSCPASEAHCRSMLIAGELHGAEAACAGLREKLSLAAPSLMQMADALKARGELTPGQALFFGKAPGKKVRGRDIAAFIRWVRSLRPDELRHAWRAPEPNIVSAASLAHRERFTRRPLLPDEEALAGHIHSSNCLRSGETLAKAFCTDLSISRAGCGLRAVYDAPDPLLSCARASMEFDTLLDFVEVRRERPGVSVEGGSGISSIHAIFDTGHPENDDTCTSISVSLPSGRSFTLDFVFDGVGGNAGGSIASMMARDTVEIAALAGWVRGPEDARMALLLADMVISMEKRIRTERNEYLLRGMGTTAVASYIENGRFCGIHCGDSQWLIIRNGEPVHQSKPHGFPDTNIIYSCVGANAGSVHINNSDNGFTPIVLEDGDYVTLCSDGISDVVCNHEQASICSNSRGDEQNAAQSIHALACARHDPAQAYLPSCGCRPIGGHDDDKTLHVRRIRLPAATSEG